MSNSSTGQVHGKESNLINVSSELVTNNVVSVCTNHCDKIDLYQKLGLYLKSVSMISITVAYPSLKASSSNKVPSFTSKDIMASLKQLIKPRTFVSLILTQCNRDFARFRAELSSRSEISNVVGKLNGSFIQVGELPLFKVRAAETRQEGPTRLDWDKYFARAVGADETKPGLRPDTVHIKGIPSAWFTQIHIEKMRLFRRSKRKTLNEKEVKPVTQNLNDKRPFEQRVLDKFRTGEHANDEEFSRKYFVADREVKMVLRVDKEKPTNEVQSCEKSEKHSFKRRSSPERDWRSISDPKLPDEDTIVQVFSTFGKIRRIDVPILNPLIPDSEGFGKFSTFNEQFQTFEVYIQYYDYLGFITAMNGLRGKRLIYLAPDDAAYSSAIKVDFDRSRHLTDASVRKRATRNLLAREIATKGGTIEDLQKLEKEREDMVKEQQLEKEREQRDKEKRSQQLKQAAREKQFVHELRKRQRRQQRIVLERSNNKKLRRLKKLEKLRKKTHLLEQLELAKAQRRSLIQTRESEALNLINSLSQQVVSSFNKQQSKLKNSSRMNWRRRKDENSKIEKVNRTEFSSPEDLGFSPSHTKRRNWTPHNRYGKDNRRYSPVSKRHSSYRHTRYSRRQQEYFKRKNFATSPDLGKGKWDDKRLSPDSVGRLKANEMIRRRLNRTKTKTSVELYPLKTNTYLDDAIKQSRLKSDFIRTKYSKSKREDIYERDYLIPHIDETKFTTDSESSCDEYQPANWSQPREKKHVHHKEIVSFDFKNQKKSLAKFGNRQFDTNQSQEKVKRYNLHSSDDDFVYADKPPKEFNFTKDGANMFPKNNISVFDEDVSLKSKDSNVYIFD